MLMVLIQVFIDENQPIADGGKVIIWSDDTTQFFGNITARGSELGGDGGFVEVSGKEYLIFQGDINTSASNGNIGTVLLDPNNINIINGSTGIPLNLSDFVWSVGEDPGSQNIGVDDINTLLISNNLTLEASNNITWNGTFNYTETSDRTLTLNAGNQININNFIVSLSNSLSLDFTADNINISNPITTNGGNINFTAENINISNPITTNGGNINFMGNTTSSNDAITISNPINSGGGDINITGISNGGLWNLD